MKKTIIMVLIAIIGMAIGIVIGVNLGKEKETTPVASENVVENKVKNREEYIEKNEIENTIENEEENVEEEPKTDLEKAIYIVKNDWGKDDTSVYYAEDGKTKKGEYIICVREKSTTKALSWYTVDITTGTYTRE